MTDNEYLERLDLWAEHAVTHLKRIADALERVSPPPQDRSQQKPADVDALKRPTLQQLRQWDDEEKNRRAEPR